LIRELDRLPPAVLGRRSPAAAQAQCAGDRAGEGEGDKSSAQQLHHNGT
jgi:hypothetical protein